MSAILIVEDDRHQRLLLEEEFAGEGYAVRAVPSAEDALTGISEAMPDLVIVDLAMPGMDGLDLLGKLLAMNNQLPVIIHTAYPSYQDNFMSWAADAYVVKRGDLTELKEAVRCVLTRGHGDAVSAAGAEHRA